MVADVEIKAKGYNPARYERTKTLLSALCEGLYEREQAVHLALLSAAAGESIFLLGPPGVGKSLIARRLKYAFRDGTSFEYLMSKFSTPDEIFGPVSIKKLKEEDKYERQIERYLPGANIVFLDEIWKAGPAIQNALLTILNEKIYRNGDEDVQVAIKGIISASNELPPPNQNLAPIWDRFLIRLEVGNIRQFGNFLNMITATDDVYEDRIPAEVKFGQDELATIATEINTVEVPPEVLNTIQVVKVKIDEHNTRHQQDETPLLIHDRRWKKVVQLLRTSAYLNGRQQVDLMDCFLMEHCLWSRPRQRELLREIITETIREHGYTMAVNLSNVRKEVRNFRSEVEAEIRVPYTTTEEQLQLVQENYYELDKDDQQFEGVLVPTKQFNQLRLDEDTVVNYYDKNGELVNRLRTYKGPQEFTIDVYHNSVRHTYPLKTVKKEQTATVDKTAHPVVQHFWEERYRRLETYLKQQAEQLATQQPATEARLRENLFVNSERADLVLYNLREVREGLQQLGLELEKIRHLYA